MQRRKKFLLLPTVVAAALATIVAATPATAAATSSGAVAPMVASRLVHNESCPSNYQSDIPDAASLSTFGAAALVPPGASSNMRAGIESNPIIQNAIANHSTWIEAECAVTDISAEPVTSLQDSIGLSNGVETTHNWSGWEFDGAGTGLQPWGYAGMSWFVPTAEAGVLTTTRAVSIWPGIGTGTSKSDVLAQDGTQTTAGPAGVQSTYAWTELYPVQPTEIEITNMSLNAGDPASATLVVSSTSATFDVCDGRGTCVQQVVAVPSGGTIGMQNAEFIAERPGIPGGDFSELNQFGTLNITYASAAHSNNLAARTWATSASWAGETTYQDDMTSCTGGTALATPVVVPSGKGNFSILWQNHGSLEKC